MTISKRMQQVREPAWLTFLVANKKYQQQHWITSVYALATRFEHCLKLFADETIADSSLHTGETIYVERWHLQRSQSDEYSSCATRWINLSSRRGFSWHRCISNSRWAIGFSALALAFGGIDALPPVQWILLTRSCTSSAYATKRMLSPLGLSEHL